MNYTMLRILPELTQHAVNFEQCLEECQKNKISYIIANQSCREAYEKNFKKAMLRITQNILGGLTWFIINLIMSAMTADQRAEL